MIFSPQQAHPPKRGWRLTEYRAAPGLRILAWQFVLLMAINTSRAARRTDIPTKGNTAEHVAPGTYANTQNEVQRAADEAPAPFLSLQQRNLNQNKGTSSLTPGPGAYLGTKAVSSQGKKDYGDDAVGLGGATLRSRSRRMGPTAPGSSVFAASTIEKNPGPGTYRKATHQDLSDRPAKHLKPPVRPVIEVLEKTTPSMPVTKLLPGQQTDADDDGETAHLRVRHTGDRGDTAGPGEYEPSSDLITRTARQSAFNQSAATRKLWEPSCHIENKMAPRENPGPGTYAPPAIEDKDPEDEVLPSSQFVSRSLMAHQRQDPPEKVLPGPGQYEFIADIDRSLRVARERAAVRGDLTQFGSMTERSSTLARSDKYPFKDPYNFGSVPGPGHYPLNTSAFAADPKANDAQKAVPDAKWKKMPGVHHPAIIMALSDAQGPLHAFQSTDDRPCNRPQDQRTPAPWSYNTETARGHSMNAELRERAKVGRRGAFGTCADRFFGSPLAGREGLVDPSADGTEGVHSNSHMEPRSAFQSASPRFHNAPGPREKEAIKLGGQDTPAPGEYEVCKDVNYKSPYRHPRTEHVSFGSARTRFDNVKASEDVFFGHRPFVQQPGPGDYEPKSARQRTKGGGSSKSSRPPPYVGCTTETVGPGSYGGVETHMLKKTFNVSTQAPVSNDASSSIMSSRSRAMTGRVL